MFEYLLRQCDNQASFTLNLDFFIRRKQQTRARPFLAIVFVAVHPPLLVKVWTALQCKQSKQYTAYFTEPVFFIIEINLEALEATPKIR